MSPARRPRLLRAALAGAAVLVVGPLLSTTSATAEEASSGETVVGEVVRTFAEPYDHEKATAVHEEPLVWIEPARGEAVRLTGKEAEQLPPGATVEVEVGGEVVDAAAATEAVEPARELLGAQVLAAAAGPVSTAAVHQVTVALVAPAELGVPAAGELTTDSDTAAEFAAVVEGAVATYWNEQSYGAIQLDVMPVDSRHQWFKSSISCENAAGLWTETANRVGFTPGPGKHLLLYLPESATPQTDAYDPCHYGWADIGTSRTSGGRAYVRDDATSVIAHELGHNFSLGHSSLVQCDSAIEGPADCGYYEYFDLYDVMGASWDHLGSLSALHGRRIGVLPLSRVHQVAATAPTRDYTLAPIGARSGFAGIRMALGDFVYWLEYRTPVNQDAWLASLTPQQPPLQQGVQLRIAEDGTFGDTSILLDGTPSPSAGWENDAATALPAKRSYWLAGGAFHVTVKSAGSSGAVVRVSTLAGAPVPRDLSGDYTADLVARDSAGVLYTYRASASGGFGTRTVSGRGWQSRDLITMAGDWDGDGAHDVIARDRGNGDLWLYRGNNRSGFAAWRVIGRGWGGFNALLAPGDWNGDGNWDLVARKRSDGSLWLYPGNGTGGFKASVRIGTGWGAMTAFAASGDWDNDGTVDLVARRNDGLLFLYSGNGSGGFEGARRIIGRGWNVFTAITGPGDWDADGDADLLVRRTDGTVLLYPGSGTGGFATPRTIGSGWSSFRLGS